MYNHRSQDFQNPKADALRKYIHQEACFLYKAASNQWIRQANEWKFRDNRAAGYGLNLPARITFFGSGFRTGVRNRATGPGYGTNIRDNDEDTGAVLSSWTRAWITMSSGMGQENGQRERATSRDKSSWLANLHITFCGLCFAIEVFQTDI